MNSRPVEASAAQKVAGNDWLSRIGRQLWLWPLALGGLFALGFGLGMWWRAPASDIPDLEGIASVDDAETDPEDEHDVIGLTKQAMSNLGLKLENVRLGEYVRTTRLPGQIVERPAYSDYALAAPVTGIVTRVHVVPGQAVTPGTPLFDLQVTDEQLIDAQLELLALMTRMRVVESEIDRLGPLARSGSVIGTKLRERELEKTELDAKRNVRIQELLVRGLDRQQVDSVLAHQKLIRQFSVKLPEHNRSRSKLRDAGAGNISPASLSTPVPANDGISIERLVAFPGKTVKRGDDLCRLAYHSKLYIQGRAFEHDVQEIQRASQLGYPIQAEFGSEGHQFVRDELSVHYISNHMSDGTQVIHFYVPIVNEVLSDTTDDAGRRFKTWRFKTGQRVHLRIPVEKLKDQIVLPAESVSREGPDTFLFALHEHPHEPEEDPHSHEFEVELEKVSVHVLYDDSEQVVVANDGALRIGQVVAINSAYELNLALKVNAGGGGGHHHDHGH